MDLILLAGGECPQDIIEYTQVNQRAALKIGEITIAQVVIKAFKPFVEKVIMVGNLNIEGVDLQLPEQKTFTQALEIGLKHSNSKYVFISTCDLPFLKPEHIQLFYDQIKTQLETQDIKFYFPLIKVTPHHPLFKNFKRTIFKSREGCITGGNIACVHTQAALNVVHQTHYFYKERKSPIKYFLKSNLILCVRALIGQIFPSIISFKKHIEPAVTKWIKSPIKIILLSCPEIGTDIDNLEHYKILQEMIKKSNNL